MEKNKNRRTFEFYKKNGKRETDTGEHKETKRGKRTGGTLRKNTLLKTFDIVPAFEASHLLWRSYENSWEQIFSAGVGASWQKHYGTDVVTQLGYGQRISWNDVIDAGATLRWEKRPYDGDREHSRAFQRREEV